MTDSEGNEIGKIFVGGLSQATNDDKLRTYFSQLGEINDSVVMMDNKTGRSRGFGYVKYKNPESVNIVLHSKPHIIDFKEVDVKQCNVNMKGKNRRSLKIFVGGINLEHDAESIKRFFEQFGVVTDINLMMDQSKLRHRGFAFVGFEDENIVKKLINMHFVNINSKQVEIKAMEPPNFTKRFQSISDQTMSAMHNQNNGFPVPDQSINIAGGFSSNCPTQSLWRPSFIQYQPQVPWQTQMSTQRFIGSSQQWTNQWGTSQCDHSQWPPMNWTCPSPWYQPLPTQTMWPSQPSNWLPILVANQASVQATKPHILAPPQTHTNDNSAHLLQPWPGEVATISQSIPLTTTPNWMTHSIEFESQTNSFDNLKNPPVQMQSNLCCGILPSSNDTNGHFGSNILSADYCNWFCGPNKEVLNSGLITSMDTSDSNIPGGGAGDFNRNTNQDSSISYYATRN